MWTTDQRTAFFFSLSLWRLLYSTLNLRPLGEPGRPLTFWRWGHEEMKSWITATSIQTHISNVWVVSYLPEQLYVLGPTDALSEWALFIIFHQSNKLQVIISSFTWTDDKSIPLSLNQSSSSSALTVLYTVQQVKYLSSCFNGCIITDMMHHLIHI